MSLNRNPPPRGRNGVLVLYRERDRWGALASIIPRGMASPHMTLSHINADTGRRAHPKMSEIPHNIVTVGSGPGPRPPTVGRPRALYWGRGGPLRALPRCCATLRGMPIQKPCARKTAPNRGKMPLRGKLRAVEKVRLAEYRPSDEVVECVLSAHAPARRRGRIGQCYTSPRPR